MSAAITVILALVTFATGLRAAWLWLAASQSSADTSVINGVPAISPWGARELAGVFHRSAQQNRRAAIWTAWTALFGAVTTVWSAITPLFMK